MADNLDEIKSKYEGTWKHYKSDNLDEFLKVVGVNMVKRKMATSTDPTCTMKVSEGKIHITMTIGPMTSTDVATLGQEMETTVMGETGKGVVTYEGGKLQFTPSASSKLPKTVREILPSGDMCVELNAKGTVAKRYFKKQ